MCTPFLGKLDMENSTTHGEHPRRRIYPPRQTLPPSVARSLRRALDESQLSYRKAASEIGISHGYLHSLVHGTRCPSKAVARSLVAALPLGWDEGQALMREAVERW